MSIWHIAMTHPLSHSTSAPSNSQYDLHLTINLNHKMTMHDDMYDMKYKQPDILCDPVLFELVR